MGLGEKFCCQRRCGAVMLLFRFEYKTSVICHNVNTQNVKILHRCETFENLFILILLQSEELFEGVYTPNI